MAKVREGDRAGRFGVFGWRGVATGVPVQVSASAFLAMVVCVAAMVVTHLGMVHLGTDAAAPIGFLHLTLVPVAAAALLFGLPAGFVMGLLAGLVAYGHATFLAANYYEQTYIGALGTIVPFLVVGLLFALTFALVDLKVKGRGARIVALFGAAWVCTSAFNTLFYALLLVYVNSASLVFDLGSLQGLFTPGVYLSAPIEAVAITVVCLLVDAIVRGAKRRYSERKLSRVFQGWLLLVVVIVFMVIGTAQFVGVSFSERDDAAEQIKSEIDYIDRQLNVHENDPVDVLDGYELSLDGSIIVVHDGFVVGSNDPSTEVGWTVDELFGYGPDDKSGLGAEALSELVEVGPTQVGMELEDGSVELSYLVVQRTGDYDILISWPLSKVYAERPITLAWTTLAILVTLAAVFLLVTLLLDRVVVRRIDETNATLGRITDGDLNARVDIRDSREFASLSTGVNTTVSALKDAISEAEQRNAQELMTAKAIQESSLPRDFPPFPDIDRFDIYASMKTAKEVGGDFYDFFLIDDDRLGFVMADVSGKGIPAALFMMTAKTQVRNYMESGIPVGEAIDAANHQLCLGNDAGMFVTLFACVLDYGTGRLAYVNAGHNPPIVLHGGAWGWMRDVSGMPLGLFEGIPYNPLAKPDAVTPDDIVDVPIGGLGILMAKKSVDSMEYRRQDGSNILTFRKGW